AALDALLLTLGGSFAWAGAPMRAAGLGSIVPLQRARTSEQVAQCLRAWARGSSNADARELLMPVVRSLWRDMLSLIPTYSLLFLCGSWIALSLVVAHAPGDVWFGLLVSSGGWW